MHLNNLWGIAASLNAELTGKFSTCQTFEGDTCPILLEFSDLFHSLLPLNLGSVEIWSSHVNKKSRKPAISMGYPRWAGRFWLKIHKWAVVCGQGTDTSFLPGGLEPERVHLDIHTTVHD